jgi:hypothetical protein
MTNGPKHWSADDGELAALTKAIRIRVLDCSTTGCLVETDVPVAAGTVAMLRVNGLGEELADTVQIVRCQPIPGAGVYHLATQFLVTGPPYPSTLRYVMHSDVKKLAGWMRTTDGT